ncbi:MAG: 3-hydroxyacyl-CoA dehydrogenase family protein [Chloroflexi bacterium]|nr:3-hydroxyacyl-CoA dehydrogenase family protein [Chloroflexota bacterium]
MRVVVLGAGLMGAQIGIEYLSGGHDVTFVARDPDALRRRVDDGLALAEQLGLDAVSAKRSFASPGEAIGEFDLVVESLPENLELKASLLGPLVSALPDAVVATNTSSLSITALGDAVGAPERTIGAHYWNPPLLMPPVEVIPGEHTDPAVTARLMETLAALGKMPIAVERDVPGFIWNRLQLAVMREALWLADNGVASPEVVDTVVREGLARRWRQVGPFAAAALGGAATWLKIGENLLPELSREYELTTLPRWLERRPEELREIRDRRDVSLLKELRREAAERKGEDDAS